MKNLTYVLLLSLTLLSVPAIAAETVVFNNFPISGQITGWPVTEIGAGYSASDSFLLPEDPTINRVNFGAFVLSSEPITSIDWVIGTVVGGLPGPQIVGGTADVTGGPIAPGSPVDFLTFAIPNFDIDDGTLYYLTLGNAVSADGSSGLVFWDENDGPASTSAWYTVGGVTASIQDGAGGCLASPVGGSTGTGTCSESFQLLDSPEPSTLALLGSGILAAFVLRRKAVRR